MVRLPNPGSDDGKWGDILNEYLSVSLSGDGKLQADTVGTNQLQNGSITTAKIASGGIAQSAVTGLVSDLTAKEPTIISGTTTQYYRGDKTWQTLNKAAVGLSNVANTADSDKPISTATQTALNAKADLTDSRLVNAAYAYLLPQAAPAAGQYVYPVRQDSSSTNSSLGNEVLRIAPFYVYAPFKIDQIGTEITTAGGVGSRIRLGVYATDTAGLPASLALDSGQLVADAVGIQTATLSSSFTFTTGWWWVGGALQSTPSSQPTVRANTSGIVPLLLPVSSLIAGGAGVTGYTQSNVSAGLPTNFVMGGTTGAIPRIHMRISN